MSIQYVPEIGSAVEARVSMKIVDRKLKVASVIRTCPSVPQRAAGRSALPKTFRSKLMF